jgi:hypothetical protein
MRDVAPLLARRREAAMDKRKDPRFKTRFDALYSSGREEGTAVLVDLSYSGARFESATIQPAPGTQVRLYIFVQPVKPFELIGHVVRYTGKGFAVELDISDDEIRSLVDDVSAIVAEPLHP